MKKQSVVDQRISVLEKYYPVDRERKTVTFKLFYHHASELLDYTVGDTGKEAFNAEFLGKVSSLLERIPVGYKADVILEIEDYDVYDEATIMEKFSDLLEMNSFEARHTSKKHGFAGATLLIVGFLILTANALFTATNVWDGTTVLSVVLKEALDITSWVFIWQAVTVLFLTENEESTPIISILTRLATFSVASKGVIRCSRSRAELSERCRIDSSFSGIQKRVLAVSSSLLFFEGLLMLISAVLMTILLLASEEGRSSAYVVIPELLLAFSIITCSILSLTRFTGHYVKNWKIVVTFLFSGVFIIISLVSSIIAASGWATILNISFTVVLLIVNFLLCFFWNTFGFRKAKKGQ